MAKKGFRPLRSVKRLAGNVLLLKRSKGNRKKKRGLRPFRTAKRLVGNALLLKRSKGNRKKSKFRPIKSASKLARATFRKALMLKKRK